VTTHPVHYGGAVRRFVNGIAVLLALGSPAWAQLRLQPFVSGLHFPVEFVQDPVTPSVQYVVEQGGTIRVISAGVLLATPFLDVSGVISSGGERGLLGLAFAPDYATSGRFFVNFTDPVGNTVVARFKRSASNALLADVSTRLDLRWGGVRRFITQPFANHNGGHLAFGPDGYLYIGMGDGGSGDDPQNNAQNPASLLGKLLRIDVSVADGDPNGYIVPADNPFTDSIPIQALPEIWACGVRNPWKFTFDDPRLGGTGAMLMGDVGQNSYEEVDYQPPGAGGRNYGWRVREGAHDHITTPGPAYLPLVDPITEYDHTVGNSITGGFVYRGTALSPFYRGRYFFADFVKGRVWSIALVPGSGNEMGAANLIEHTAGLGGTAALGNISSFGIDARGELYIVNYSAGSVLKVVETHNAGVDFDGDGRSDLAVFRRSSHAWYVLGSGTGTMASVQWGASTDTAVPGDYDGDGKSDYAVYRPSTGMWYVIYSSTGAVGQGHWGGDPSDIPVPCDYDGDGKTDPAVYRKSVGNWYVIYSSTGAVGQGHWGGDPSDIPVPADYDGDGKADAAVYRKSTGNWYVIYSSTGAIGQGHWGGDPSDIPVPGDYDGDGKADPAVYRKSVGNWFVLYSSTGAIGQGRWGGDPNDIPVPADYDGDGKTDPAIYNKSQGNWYIRYSSNGTIGQGHWGGDPSDVPVTK
jgi:glucose/arabinose dehydrogenase